MDGTRNHSIRLLLLLVLAAGCGSSEPQRLEDTSNYHLQLAYGHWQGGQVPQCIEELQMALAIDPNNAEAHYMLGFVFSGRQMFNESIQHYRQALLLEPDNYDVQNNLGVVFLQLERWEEAAEIFEALTQIPAYHTPGHAHNNLGWSQLHMGQVREALSNFEMASFLQPDLCLAYNNQGIALIELERAREAEEAFETAIQRCPAYAEPRFRLARQRHMAGQYEEARLLFQECADLVPNANLGRRCQEYLEE